MADDESWLAVSVMLLRAVERGLNIIECTRPAATRLSNTAVFYVGSRQSACSDRCTEMPGMRQIVSLAPETPMNHDDDSGCNIGSWKSKVNKLTPLFAIGHSKVGRWWRKG